MPKTSVCLWFDTQAEEAANHYLSVFPGARILASTRYAKGMPGPESSVLTVTVELGGVEYTLLNGGKHFTLSPAASIVVHCESQADIDRFWSALSAVREAEQCGWCVDRFGVSWQVVPERLFAMLQDPDAGRRQRVTEAFMQMKKFDLAALEAAYAKETS